MGSWARVGQQEAHGRVGAEVVDVPFWGVGVRVVAHVGEKQDWLVVVCAEGGVVHCPEPVARFVLAEFDVDVLSYWWG